jgi:hypothetical protein
MDLNKVPRWALIALAIIGVGASNILVTTARADLEKFRTIAFQAKGSAEDALAMGTDLKVQVQEVRISQEIFRKEYREDQKDLDRRLTELLKAVKS